jgi:hypothetical protein
VIDEALEALDLAMPLAATQTTLWAKIVKDMAYFMDDVQSPRLWRRFVEAGGDPNFAGEQDSSEWATVPVVALAASGIDPCHPGVAGLFSVEASFDGEERNVDHALSILVSCYGKDGEDVARVRAWISEHDARAATDVAE